MELNAFFDASFLLTCKRGMAAMFVKNVTTNTVMAESAKQTKCQNTTHAEFKALRRLVNHINQKQKMGLLPKNLVIHIYGDNLGIIKYAKSLKRYKGLSNRESNDFFAAYKILKNNNSVTLSWVSRDNNSAHKVITRKIFYIKSIINHSLEQI